jgi:hypothetical protein
MLQPVGDWESFVGVFEESDGGCARGHSLHAVFGAG